MLDLFGGEVFESKVGAPAVTVSLFDAAAERLAIASGRPVSQERTELVHPPRALRYQVTHSGTAARPFEVVDTAGGWVCSGHKTFCLAQDRADELNAQAPQ